MSGLPVQWDKRANPARAGSAREKAGAVVSSRGSWHSYHKIDHQSTMVYDTNCIISRILVFKYIL
jgi:hypothetical protein